MVIQAPHKLDCHYVSTINRSKGTDDLQCYAQEKHMRIWHIRFLVYPLDL
jgi:hypothetical protein